MGAIIEGAWWGGLAGFTGAILGIALVEGLNDWADFPPNGPDSDGYSSFHNLLEPYGLQLLASNKNWYVTLTLGGTILGSVFGMIRRVSA